MRNETIGSSEIAAVLGLDPHRTPYDVWLTKTGQQPEFSGNEATKRGNILEPAVANWFEDTYGEYKTASVIDGRLYKYGRCSATPDRVYREENGKLTICEIKTTRLYIDADNLPQKWFLQAMYQAAVMLKGFHLKTDFVYVAWLDAGLNFGAQVFLPDYEFGEKLLNEAENWYSRHVIHGEPPEPTTAKDVKRMYPKSSAKSLQANDSILEVYTKAFEAKRRMESAEAEYEVFTDALKLLMRDAEELEYMGNTLVTWKSTKDSSRFDAKALKEVYPELYEEFIKVSAGTRQFRLK
jgi:putative phage-type endonuclease